VIFISKAGGKMLVDMNFMSLQFWS